MRYQAAGHETATSPQGLFRPRPSAFGRCRPGEPMAIQTPSGLPPLNPEHRRIAAGQFERANQVVATGNFDYGIQPAAELLQARPGQPHLSPDAAAHREGQVPQQPARQLARLADHLAGQGHASRPPALPATTSRCWSTANEVLTRNPWDVGAQMDMAEAADAWACSTWPSGPWSRPGRRSARRCRAQPRPGPAVREARQLHPGHGPVGADPQGQARPTWRPSAS